MLRDNWLVTNKKVNLQLDNESLVSTKAMSHRTLLSVFSPQGVTPTSKFVCVLPFPDGDALSWFGQEKALRPAGGREFVLSCT